MNINIYSFLLPIFAGLSTLLGTILIFFKYKNTDNILINTLAFAAGVMITISFTDLIPESYDLISNYFYKIPTILVLLIFFCLGNIIALFIDKKLKGKGSNSNLYNVGIISMLAIILHNIPEGMVTFIATSSNLKLGISLTLAIMFHNIPEGISISVPIYYATKKKSRAIGYTLISALSEPLGALLTFLFLRNYINNFILGILYAMIAGIMIHIAIYELIPESLSYKKLKNTLFYVFLGIIITILATTLF